MASTLLAKWHEYLELWAADPFGFPLGLPAVPNALEPPLARAHGADRVPLGAPTHDGPCRRSGCRSTS